MVAHTESALLFWLPFVLGREDYAEVACFGKVCSFNLISTLFLGIQPLSCLPVC